MADVVRTNRGYSEHGLTPLTIWRSGHHVLVPAVEVLPGDILRIDRIGREGPSKLLELPSPPVSDPRAVVYRTPPFLTEDVAELFGMTVADGTLFKGGIRMAKKYRSVIDRYAHLLSVLFGATPIVRPFVNTLCVEFHSTQVVQWLLLVGGMAPHRKRVPECVLGSPLSVQGAFLRGLFEDGTVNIKTGNRIDHVHWDNIDSNTVETVQRILLTFGIVSSVAHRGYVSSLYIYSEHAREFRDQIGFVASEKNHLLATGTFSEDRKSFIPITEAETVMLRPLLSITEYQNARSRGRLSRRIVRRLLAHDDIPEFVGDRFGWLYDPITSVS